MNIKNRLLICATLAAGMLLTSCGGEQTVDDAALAEPAEASTETLDNGLKLIVRPHDTAGAPLVTVAARLEAGSDQESPPEAGFAMLLARLMAQPPEESATASLAELGSALVVDLQPDGLVLSATVLAADAEAARAALFETLMFERDDEAIDASRTALAAELRAAEGAPGVLEAELIDYYFFPLNAYGARLAQRAEALEEATPQSIREFAQRCLRPEKAVVAATGAITKGLAQSLRSDAAGWDIEVAEPPFREWLEPERVVAFTVVDRGGDDASLTVARRLPEVGHEAVYHLMAVNFILNGQSTYSRLTGLQVLAELDTPIASNISIRRDGSLQSISTRVPARSAMDILDQVRNQTEVLYGGRVKGARLTEQEISDARNSLRGGLLQRTETTEQIARFILWSEGFGFPSFEPADHLALIDAIDKEALLAAIAQYFDPQGFILVASGPLNTLRSQLGEYGEVEVVRP